MATARLVVRLAFDSVVRTSSIIRKETGKRVLIVGAGRGGASLSQKLALEGYDVVGFVDDSWAKRKMQINGFKVLGRSCDIENLVKGFRVDEVIIAIPSISKSQLKKITDECLKAKVQFRTLPSIKEILDFNQSPDHLREVKVEDLLGREPIRLDKALTRSEIKDQTIMVTGAGGSIGSELCRQILEFGPRSLIMFERSEYNLFHIERELRRRFPNANLSAVIGDICDEVALDRVFLKHRPKILYHTAAYKHVPLMEESPREAIVNNVFGTRGLAQAAVKFGVAKFVMISTDKAIRPLSVMGYSKRLAEIITQDLAAKSETSFMSVRFGNVLGSSGSVVEIFRKQLAEGGPLSVTDAEARRFFMTTPEAVELVLHAGSHGSNGSIYMLDMGESVKIYDLAKRMIDLADPMGQKNIQIEVTGLRPGEKLKEEILWEGEDLIASNIDHVSMFKNIVSIQGLELGLSKLYRCIHSTSGQCGDELKALVNTIDAMENIRRPLTKKDPEVAYPAFSSPAVMARVANQQA